MKILPAADPHIVGNLRYRNLALSQQHPGFLHTQLVQVVSQGLPCVRPEDAVQIARVNIHRERDFLNLEAPVIILMQELDGPPHIEL